MASDDQRAEAGGNRQGVLEAPSVLFNSVLKGTAVGVIWQDHDLRIAWTSNLPIALSKAAEEGAVDADYLPTEQLEEIATLKQQALLTGQPRHFTLTIPTGPTECQFDLLIRRADTDPPARPALVTTIIDTTERWQYDRTLKGLMLEVSHRTKNLLAIVQGMASLTARHSTSIDPFMFRLRSRLHSLAKSQDLVTSSDWRGASLKEIVLGQVEQYCGSPANLVIFEGDNPYLNPNAVVYVGLAFHELAANSASFGALSRVNEPVRIKSQPTALGSDALMSISWSEGVADQNASLSDKRFGGIALERVVPASLDGSASWTIKGDRLLYVLNMPVSNLVHR